MHRLVLVIALAACKGDPEVIVDPLTTDDDGDGLTENQGDCDDDNPNVSPNATDAPGDGFDADCDNQELCFRDDDKDGFPRNATRVSADLDCDDEGEIGAGVAFDCDDGRADVHPDATELVGDNVDSDCDGKELCYTDADNDNFGPGGTMTSNDRDCDDNGEGRYDGDCEDGDASISPGATEVPGDGVDQDCDALETCYVDADGDGFGGTTTGTSSKLDCKETGLSKVAGDCDDTDKTKNGGDPETPGDGIDSDCDGKEICYVDEDEDGARSTVTAESADPDCTDAGEALAGADPDCDDTDPTRFPDATELVDNGIDETCDGKELCYADADEDGSRANTTVSSTDLDCADAKEATALAGEDCDDTDASVFEDVGCRPVAGCTRVPATLLSGFGYTAFDLAVAGDCSTWLAITSGGTDGAYHVFSTGASTFFQVPTASQDASSVAIDDANGAVYVGCNSPAELTRVSGPVLVSVAPGSGTLANPDWSGILGEEPMSLAVAPNGDVWVPQLSAANTLHRVTPTGTVSTVGAAFGGHIASVGANRDGDAYVGVGTELVKVSDRSVAHTFGSNVVDFVFDYNDDLYVEIAGGEIQYIDHRGTTQALHATITGRGKLAITPDGFLQRVRVDYPTTSTFTEWDISAR